MRNFANLLLLLLLLFASPVAMAQGNKTGTPGAATAKEGQITWKSTHVNLGNINEDDGKKAFSYEFTNTGTAPVQLTNVQPSCGCTASEWTKEEVKPGGKGYIRAEFDPAYKKGPQYKSITVNATGSPGQFVLTFEGTVIPHVPTALDTYSTVSGNLRFAGLYINLGDVANNKKDARGVLKIYNPGPNPVTLKGIRSVGPNNYVVAESKSDVVVKPGQRIEYGILYDASANKSFGLQWDEVKLLTDDTKEPEKKANVVVNIIPYIPPMTDAELAKAARLTFETRNHDFGDIQQGDKVLYKFKFTNTGKNELTILDVKTSCGCTASHPEKSVLKPGESSFIEVSFDSNGKSGKDKKTITVYSNDPTAPATDLMIESNIQTPANK